MRVHVLGLANDQEVVVGPDAKVVNLVVVVFRVALVRSPREVRVICV
jgi:hypothetical protein